jgi:hypothetical protein
MEPVMAVNVTGVFLMCRPRCAACSPGDPQRGARAHRQHLLPARHDRLARGLLYGVSKVGGRLSDAPDRADYGKRQHHLQRRGAGQDPDRQGRPRRSSRAGSTTATRARRCRGSAAPRTWPTPALFLASDEATSSPART